MLAHEVPGEDKAPTHTHTSPSAFWNGRYYVILPYFTLWWQHL